MYLKAIPLRSKWISIGEKEFSAVVTIPPPAWWFLCLIYGIAIHFVWPVKQLIPFPYTLIGIIPLLWGGFITIQGDQIFRRRKTTIKPHEMPSRMVTDGPFSYSRNPIYLGMAGILAGVAILLGSMTPWLGPLAFFILMDRVYLPFEEKMLSTVFGSEYDSYRNRVRRWV